MFHLVARAVGHTLLFRSWREGLHLWDTVVKAAPGLDALCLMPDHIHLLHESDVRERLAAALSGFARWRTAARGVRGPVFQPLPAPEPLVDDEQVRRSVRCVHLDPVRATADARLGPLVDGDLGTLPGWAPYRRRS